MDTTIVCICGLPASQHGEGMTNHPPITEGWAQGVRDTQSLRKGLRRGHWEIVEPRVVTIVAPSAGVDVKATVPQNGKWEVWAMYATLTTDATVAARVPHIIIQDPQAQHTVYNVPSLTNQIASTIVKYTGAPAVVNANFDNASLLVLPVDMPLLGNWSIGFLTTALDPGDQWSAMSLLVLETLYV